MAYCTNCGTEIADDAEFCTTCGNRIADEQSVETPEVTEPVVQAAPPAAEVRVPEQIEPQPRPVATMERPQTPPRVTPPPYQPQYQPPTQFVAPAKPTAPVGFITTGGWIGILFLMCIPAVNLFLAIIWACGGCSKQQKTTFARGALVVMFTLTLLAVIALVTVLVIFRTHGIPYYFYDGYWQIFR